MIIDRQPASRPVTYDSASGHTDQLGGTAVDALGAANLNGEANGSFLHPPRPLTVERPTPDQTAAPRKALGSRARPSSCGPVLAPDARPVLEPLQERHPGTEPVEPVARQGGGAVARLLAGVGTRTTLQLSRRVLYQALCWAFAASPMVAWFVTAPAGTSSEANESPPASLRAAAGARATIESEVAGESAAPPSSARAGAADPVQVPSPSPLGLTPPPGRETELDGGTEQTTGAATSSVPTSGSASTTTTSLRVSSTTTTSRPVGETAHDSRASGRGPGADTSSGDATKTSTSTTADMVAPADVVAPASPEPEGSTAGQGGDGTATTTTPGSPDVDEREADAAGSGTQATTTTLRSHPYTTVFDETDT